MASSSLYPVIPTDAPFRRVYRPFFEATAHFDPSKPLDMTHGRVSLPSGIMVFSPNSIQSVSLPSAPKGSKIPLQNPLLHDLGDLLLPRWWSLNSAFLAFIPLDLDYSAYPFNFLLDGSFTRTRKRGFGNILKMLRLRRLELDLLEVMGVLAGHYKIPHYDEFIEGTAVTFRGHQELRDLKREYQRTCSWYAVYVGILSYLIAAAMSIDKDDLKTSEPTWLTKRDTMLTDQVLLSGIWTTASGFSGYCRRVGVFVDILNPSPNQPSVDFFVKFQIPVWYPWGDAEVNAARTRPDIARLAPLTHQIQRATTTLLKYPSPASSILESTAVPAASSTSKVDLPWKAHFEKRKRAGEIMLASESPQERQRRMSRTQNPPTGRTTTVYTWDVQEDGSYKRVLTQKAENSSTLEEYVGGQKRYDPLFNEWECCHAWHKPTVEEEDDRRFDEDDEDGFDMGFIDNPSFELLDPPSPPHYPIAQTEPSGVHSPSTSAATLPSPPTAVLPSANPSSFSSSPYPPTTKPRSRTAYVLPPLALLAPKAPELVQDVYEIDELHITDTLYEYFGFVAPSPIPHHHPTPVDVTDAVISHVASIAGQRQLDSSFTTSALFQYCLAFVKRLQDPLSPPPAELHDLARGNRLYIGNSLRLPSLKRTGTLHISLMLPGSQRQAAWLLTVADPDTALFLLRLRPTLCDLEICRILLQRGIAFNTLLPNPRIPRREAIPLRAPIRLSHYQFSSMDYDVYLTQRNSLLANPRVHRAALMSGGILWRLAIGGSSFSAVVSGPTTAATIHGVGLWLPGPTTSNIYCDDGLLPGEEDVLCGLVYRYTETRNQTEKRSWWPHPGLWRKEMGAGGWNELCENVYERRTAAIRDGIAVPLNGGEWRAALRGPKSIRAVHKVAHASAAQFLNQALPAFAPPS